MELKPVFRKLFGIDTKAVRIPMKPGDKKERFVQFKLDSSFQFLDFLSLRLAETDAYRLFRADYGVVAGRVIGNEGIGIPNCRISLFIPRSPVEIADIEVLSRKDLETQLVDGMYPYDVVTDEDSQGRRYNILPSAPRNRGFNGFPENNLGIGATPKVPVGSFVEKEDILTNPSLFSVYNKYYRYTTVTNEAGDYMLFGVPTGNHTLHMDCDLTDIGRWSLSPILMNQTMGFPKDLFDEDGTAILPSTDLGTLPNIQSLNVSVQVKPLWSQEPDQEGLIGITRQDFKITAVIKPFFTLFGANFTMSKSKFWGDNILFRLHFGWKNLCLQFGPKVRQGPLCRPSPIFYFDITFGISWYIEILGKRFGFRHNYSDQINGLRVKIEPTVDIQVPNVMPFVRFEIFDNYCRLNGGKFDNNALDIINHGNTCQCSVDKALEEIPDTGITDALLLRSHRADKLNIRLFNVKPEGLSDIEAETIRLAIAATAGSSAASNNLAVRNADPEADIELMRDSAYVKLVEDGQFILQVPTNRKLMVTAEDGRLVQSQDPKRGVFTEFRGYMYVSSNGDIDNPPHTDRTGRIALKIPQSFDYATKPKDWTLDHGVFQAGELYSVASKVATKTLTNENVNNINDLEDDADLDGTFNGVKGWDNQTGLIMDAQDAANPIRDYGMVGNHETSVGSENDYIRSDGTNYYGSDNSGGSQTGVIDPNQNTQSTVIQYGTSTPVGPHTGKIYPNGVTELGFKLSVAYDAFGSLPIAPEANHRPATIRIEYQGALPTSGVTMSLELYCVSNDKSYIMDNLIPMGGSSQLTSPLGYKWEGHIPSEFITQIPNPSPFGPRFLDPDNVEIQFSVFNNEAITEIGYSRRITVAL